MVAGDKAFYVICCNDSVEYVVSEDIDPATGDLMAKEIMECLAVNHFEKNKGHYSLPLDPGLTPYEYYKFECRWHILKTPGR